MKNIVVVLIALLAFCGAKAQSASPVQWSYSAVKTADKTYDVTITATVPKPWHLYSQTTPDGGPRPTKIDFKKNPLVTITGTPKEKGTLKTTHDKNFGVDVKYYSDKVEFIQTVKLKAAATTSVSGVIEFMVCDDTQCLPPSKQAFNIKLQ